MEITITIKKPPKIGGAKKKRRSAKNKRTGKYEKQRIRTAANKARKAKRRLAREGGALL